MINFACISPHPPIILPSVGSEEDRKKVKSTINNLEKLGNEFAKENPDVVIISSPHQDWGFNVPLFSLAPDFHGKVEKVMIGLEPPEFYFEKGKNFYASDIKDLKSKIALIASGDMSHVLKEEGPYGFNPQGPKFDESFIEALRQKDIKTILGLDEKYPEAAECGLRSFCFMLGILEASGINYQPEILSYEGPFGVGYLVAGFRIK